MQAKYEVLGDMKMSVNLYSPRENNDGDIFVASHAGELLRYKEDEKKFETAEIFMGQLNSKNNLLLYLLGITFDMYNNLYVSCLANAMICYQNVEEIHNLEQLVKEYDGIPFKGPCSIAYNKDENIIYFSDAGYFGTTSLNRPKGSLFTIELESRITKPILLDCLAYPADIVYDQLNQILYVAETFTNRVLRIVQNPPGQYHSSTFYQFSGRVGPTALCLDDTGNLFVARFEFQTKENDENGIISAINRDGKLVGELLIPKKSEITGLLIPLNSHNTKMYITEKKTNGMLSIDITNFETDIDKVEEFNKVS